MKTIHFQADGTALTVSQEDRVGLVAGCHGYYELEFDLSNDFLGCKVACEFSTKNIKQYASLKANKCLLPDDIADQSSYKVRLIAMKGATSQIITNKVLIEQEGGGISG